MKGSGYIPPAQVDLSASQLQFEPAFSGQSAQLEVRVKNSGGKNLVVSSIESEHDTFSVEPLAFELGPGKSQKLSLAFQPSQPGQQQGQLTLQTNVGPHTIQLLGQASLSPPQLSVAESELDFGLLEALGQKKLVLELANQGGQPLEISSLQIEPAEPFTSATTVPLMVAGNQDEPIELVFGPQEDGLFEARLTIDSNGGQLELELSGQRALLPPVAHSLQILLASDQLPANGMASSQLLITVYAEDGRLVKDETIQLSASSGEIEAEVTYQDEAYQATYTAGTVVGEVMLMGPNQQQ